MRIVNEKCEKEKNCRNEERTKCILCGYLRTYISNTYIIVYIFILYYPGGILFVSLSFVCFLSFYNFSSSFQRFIKERASIEFIYKNTNIYLYLLSLVAALNVFGLIFFWFYFSFFSLNETKNKWNIWNKKQTKQMQQKKEEKNTNWTKSIFIQAVFVVFG